MCAFQRPTLVIPGRIGIFLVATRTLQDWPIVHHLMREEEIQLLATTLDIMLISTQSHTPIPLQDETPEIGGTP